MRLALLAPDIIEAVLAGGTDQALMLGRLERPLPASCEEQRRLLPVDVAWGRRGRLIDRLNCVMPRGRSASGRGHVTQSVRARSIPSISDPQPAFGRTTEPAAKTLRYAAGIKIENKTDRMTKPKTRSLNGASGR